MKTGTSDYLLDLFFKVSIGVGMVFISTALLVIAERLRVPQTEDLELIQVYTCDDIYYLRGNTLTSESGRYDRTFQTRTEAVRMLEEHTAADSRHNCKPIEPREFYGIRPSN